MHSSRMRTGRSLTLMLASASRGGGVSGPGGSAWSGGRAGPWSQGGGSLVPGGVLPGRGVSGFGEGGLASQHALRQAPPCGQNHRRL